MTATVGIDVGGSTIKAVRWDGSGVAELYQEPTPKDAGEILRRLAPIVERLGPDLEVGVGLAGLVDHRRGVLTWAPHLPGVDLDVRGYLGRELGRGVVVDNDANLAALAEHILEFGEEPGTTVLLTLGTGIGMGMIVNGRIFHGRGYAGEVGHVIVDPDGEMCECGRRGCWETVVSGSRLDTLAMEVLGPGASGADLVAAADGESETAQARLGEALGWLAAGIEAIVLMLDPDVVVVGGAVSEAGESVLEPVRRRLADTQGAGHRAVTRVRASILGGSAGAVGAAMAAGRAAEGKLLEA